MYSYCKSKRIRTIVIVVFLLPACIALTEGGVLRFPPARSWGNGIERVLCKQDGPSHFSGANKAIRVATVSLIGHPIRLGPIELELEY